MSADLDRGGSAFQDWTLDALGNWAGFTDQGDSQTRDHNAANETGAISGDLKWIDPTYDDAGNMTSGPAPGAETTEYKFVYDAWNRLVKVTDSAGTTTIAEYRYDGLGRRIAKLVPNGENWDRTDYHYNEAWQCLEQRYGQGRAKETVPDTPNVQYLWDVRYVDAPVLRWRSVSGTLDETLYYCNDANMNVTALIDPDSGEAVERYVYDAYGKATVCDEDWTPRQGNTSAYASEILYSGYRFDAETGLYQVRFRYYHPTLGRWMQRDPKGHVDGMGMYEYVQSCPPSKCDPTGESTARPLAPPLYFGLNGPQPGIPQPAPVMPPPPPRSSAGFTDARDICAFIITTEITLYGPNATQELAAQWKAAMQTAWPNTFTFEDTQTGGVCSVSFNFNIMAQPTSNYFFTAWGDHKIYVAPGKGDSYVSRSTGNGTWYAGKSDWVAAHEAGHLMGLHERYHEGFGSRVGGATGLWDRVTVPDTGWAGNIMAEFNGTVDAGNIKELVEKVIRPNGKVHCPCECQESEEPDFQVP